MKTVLIAVLSCTGEPFADMAKTQLETWDSVNVDGVDTMFYFPRDYRGKHPHTMAVDMDAGFYTQGKRDLLAFDWLLRNRKWDYMARVNASCYVRKKLLLEAVQSLPDKGVFRGVSAGHFIYGGTHYIMTPDVIQAIVGHGDKWDHSKMEDVAMSQLVKRIGIPWDEAGLGASINDDKGKWKFIAYGSPSFDMPNHWDIRQNQTQYFIRTKHYTNPKMTLQIMRDMHANGI